MTFVPVAVQSALEFRSGLIADRSKALPALLFLDQIKREKGVW